MTSIVRARDRRPIALDVRRIERISPGFITVTLAGEELADFAPAGPDQSVRLFFPRDGQERLVMPTTGGQAWTLQMLATPVARRPWVRLYTVRAARPAAGEIDVEIALHGDSPASHWALTAQPGSPAGIIDEGHTYHAMPDMDCELLVGDGSALPAITAILDSAAPTYKARVFIEVADSADIRTFDHLSAGVDVRWVVCGDATAIPGRAVLDEVMRTELPEGRVSAWIAGEQHLPTQLRRYLVAQGIPKRQITFTGYWRHGRASIG